MGDFESENHKYIIVWKAEEDPEIREKRKDVSLGSLFKVITFFFLRIGGSKVFAHCTNYNVSSPSSISSERK